jgi:hypothetical protein
MDSRKVALASGLVFCLLIASVASILLIGEKSSSNLDVTEMLDPLLQDEEHDHRNASQHVMYTDNIQPVSFNELTAPGNAEIQVAESQMAKPMHILQVGQSCTSSMSPILQTPLLPEFIMIQIHKFLT